MRKSVKVRSVIDTPLEKYLFCLCFLVVFGLQEGDLLAALNDDPVTIGNFNQYKHLIYRPNIDQPLQITIRRQRLGQSFTFSATPYVTPKTTQHAIRQTKNATAKALQRKAWVLYERAEE